jgi:hypothetical protein
VTQYEEMDVEHPFLEADSVSHGYAWDSENHRLTLKCKDHSRRSYSLCRSSRSSSPQDASNMIGS